jgi:alpha-tubulin suppressor-like RCC1 family protein
MRLSLSHVLSLALGGLAVLGCVDRAEVLRLRADEAMSSGGAAGEGSMPPLSSVVVSELAVGESHVAAIAAERLYLWGANESGQLGQNDTVERHVPTELVTDLRFVSIASGNAHLCGIDDVGSVYCWGANDRGQLGQGDLEGRLVPTRVTLPVSARSVTTSFAHACALLSDASLYCWGRNEEGELGQDDSTPPMDNGAIADALTPVALPGNDWSWADAGDGFTCGIRLDGTLWCWGRNSQFQLGTEPAGQVRRPIQVGADTDWLRVDAGQHYAFAIKQDHSLWCWGLNTASGTGGGFPLGIDTDRLEAPTRLGAATDWVTFAASVFHTCAVNRAGELWCWGRTIEGQLGIAELEPRTSPVAVATDIAGVALSWFNTCALSKTGRVLCTGKNDYGQIGNASTERPLRFTDVTPIAP